MSKNLLLIIGFVWPEPNSSAAGKRMLQLIALFKSWNYEIIFASTASENDINFDLNLIGVTKVGIKLNSPCFDDFVKKVNPSIVLFDRFITEEHFGWRISSQCPNAVRILDSEDLHCLRLTRQNNFKKHIPFHIENLFEEEITKREIASILRCDLTLIIAQFEIDLLVTYFKIDAGLLLYFPILFEANEWELKAENLDFHKRRNFVFIGNFWHEPNWDAVLYLKKVIWPSIRMMMPSAVLYIYGAYPSQKVFDLHNKKQGFHVMGRADSSEKVISEARVLLAPLRFGAGIKGKLLEAMQYGTPSITTQIGAESINDNFDWSGFVADNSDEFASKATILYQDEILWRQAQAKGTLILQNRFCFAAFEPVFKIKLDDLLLNLAKHRKFNFIGGLLNHQTMKSTEYMSRWIEEKNKK